MEEIKMSEYRVTNKTIMVFAEGTILKPKCPCLMKENIDESIIKKM